jgi:hypothetical protein
VSRHASSVASAALAAAFVAIALLAAGGNELSRQTLIEEILIIGCGAFAAIGVAYGRSGHNGRGSLLLFGLLALLCALSVLWSIAPDVTWVEANRTFAYFAVFAAGVVAGRLFPGGYAVLLRAVLGAVAVLTLYALASRVWPEQLGGATEIYARISEPFGYWNAVGVTAALGVVPALWLGARRSGHQPANALAYPLMGWLYMAMFLSFSRGSLIAAGLGALVWFAFVPLRLRSLPVLVAPALATAPVLAWALGKDEFTKDGIDASVRATVGPEFGLIVIVVSLLLLAIGLAIAYQERDWIPSFRLRRRAGVTAVAIALAIPLLLLTSVAMSSRGLPGTVSARWHELTSESASTPGGPQRLIRASSTRGRYWRQAGRVFGDVPVTGTGAGTFGIARLRYRKDQLVAQHAHGFIAQTAADLGALGLLVILAFTGAWFISAARTTGVERHSRRREGAPSHWDADRIAMCALALGALVYAFQSAIDWTWFVPGPTVMAILMAGYVAGRGPAPQPVGAPAGIVAAGAPRDATLSRLNLRLPPRPPLDRLIPAVLVMAVALCAAWAVLQPQRAANANQDALDLLAAKKLPEAMKKADQSLSINPASVNPLWTKAAIAVAQNKPKEAETMFQRAVFDQPSNPEGWTRLAEFELYRNNQPKKALDVVKGALFLDPRSAPAQTVYFDALRHIRNEP